MKNKKRDLFYWFHENRKTAGIIALILLILAIISFVLYLKNDSPGSKKFDCDDIRIDGSGNEVCVEKKVYPKEDIPEPKFDKQILKKNESVKNVEAGTFFMTDGYSTTVKVGITSKVQIPRLKIIIKNVNVLYIKPNSYPLSEGGLISFRLGPRETENDIWPFIMINNAQGSYRLIIYTAETMQITESDIVIEYE